MMTRLFFLWILVFSFLVSAISCNAKKQIDVAARKRRIFTQPKPNDGSSPIFDVSYFYSNFENGLWRSTIELGIQSENVYRIFDVYNFKNQDVLKYLVGGTSEATAKSVGTVTCHDSECLDRTATLDLSKLLNQPSEIFSAPLILHSRFADNFFDMIWVNKNGEVIGLTESLDLFEYDFTYQERSKKYYFLQPTMSSSNYLILGTSDIRDKLFPGQEIGGIRIYHQGPQGFQILDSYMSLSIINSEIDNNGAPFFEGAIFGYNFNSDTTEIVKLRLFPKNPFPVEQGKANR